MDAVEHVLADGLEAVRLRRAELRESISALEQALAAPAPGRSSAWAERVHVALVELSADLRQHVEVTEGRGGLHDDVLAAAPRLAGQVRRLAREHPEIVRVVEDLLARASEPCEPAAVDVVRSTGTALLGRLVRHRQAGADLVFQAYEADIGGET